MLFGKSHDAAFAALFEQHIANTVQCAARLEHLLLGAKSPNTQEDIDAINALEHTGDRLAGDVYELVDRTFIATFDKADIIKLLKELDDIIDAMHDVARYFGIYRLVPDNKIAQDMAVVIKQMVASVHLLIGQLNKRQWSLIGPELQRIKGMEEHADSMLYQGLSELFAAGDTAKFIVWKDVLEALEVVTDHCEHAAEMISSIARKEAR